MFLDFLEVANMCFHYTAFSEFSIVVHCAVVKAHIDIYSVYTFYKNLLCKLCNPSEENGDSFDDYLESMLPDFSKSGLFSAGGSGDDVSVAGIVDVEAVRKHTERFSNEIALYDLENKLFVQRAEKRDG